MISLQEIADLVNKKQVDYERMVDDENLPVQAETFGEYVAPFIRLLIRTNRGG